MNSRMRNKVYLERFTDEPVSLAELVAVDAAINALGHQGEIDFYNNIPQYGGRRGDSYEHPSPGHMGMMGNIGWSTYGATIERMRSKELCT